jgi:hypothetical protein
MAVMSHPAESHSGARNEVCNPESNFDGDFRKINNDGITRTAT